MHHAATELWQAWSSRFILRRGWPRVSTSHGDFHFFVYLLSLRRATVHMDDGAGASWYVSVLRTVFVKGVKRQTDWLLPVYTGTVSSLQSALNSLLQSLCFPISRFMDPRRLH